MKVGIDTRMAHFNWSGIRRYILGLINGLAELDESGCSFTSFRHVCDLSQSRELPSSVKRGRLLTVPRMPLENFFLSMELATKNLDVFHAPECFCPAKTKLPLVFTVHDLYFLREPASIDEVSFRYYSKIRDYSKNAAQIICDSMATAADLVELCEVESARVKVVMPGFDYKNWCSSKLSPTVMRSVAKQFDGCLLMIGTVEPRKNHLNAFLAYADLIKRLGIDKTPPLVLVGRIGFQGESILSNLERLGIEDKVHYLGSVSESELKALYHASSVLIYPSLYEGFGFPILEAMATGTAVITSNSSSMPEVAGQAAVLVEASDHEQLSAEIERVLCDEALLAGLVARGFRRVREFSWQRTAAETLDVYKIAAGADSPG